MKKFNQTGNINLILIGILVVVISVVVFFGYSKFSKKATPSLKNVQETVSDLFVVKAITAKAINDKTGEPINPTKYFSPTQADIFLVNSLKSAPLGTHIEFVRYFNGIYLDHGSVTLSKANLKNVSFNWGLKKGVSKHKAGIYRVRVYSNGKLEKRLNYVVQ